MSDALISITDKAAARIKSMQQIESNPNLFLRIQVDGGGCSGFKYHLDFDDQLKDEDHVFENAGAKLVIDDMSLGLLGGSEVDYVEELIGSQFQIRNPNATASCGCGTSFSVM